MVKFDRSAREQGMDGLDGRGGGDILSRFVFLQCPLPPPAPAGARVSARTKPTSKAGVLSGHRYLPPPPSPFPILSCRRVTSNNV